MNYFDSLHAKIDIPKTKKLRVSFWSDYVRHSLTFLEFPKFLDDSSYHDLVINTRLLSMQSEFASLLLSMCRVVQFSYTLHIFDTLVFSIFGYKT